MPFNTGDTATGAQAIKIEMDLLKNDSFEVICANSFSEALNYGTETWYDFCSNGFSSSATTSIDLEFSGEAVVRFDEATMTLTKLRFDIGAVNNIPMRITDTFVEQVYEINVSMTSFERTLLPNELMKISFTFKPFQGAPVVTALPILP